MAERLTKERVEREDGYLYYLGQDGYIWRTPMRNNPKGKKSKVGSEKVSREEGYLYFVDKDGYAARTPFNKKTRDKLDSALPFYREKASPSLQKVSASMTKIDVQGLAAILTKADPTNPITVKNGNLINSKGENVSAELEQQLKQRKQATGGGCFIATAAFGTPFAEEVYVLRKWRDTKLLSNPLGRFFVAFYYWISPSIAGIVAKSEKLKKIVRFCLTPFVRYLEKKS